jgi:hypothetical protein
MLKRLPHVYPCNRHWIAGRPRSHMPVRAVAITTLHFRRDMGGCRQRCGAGSVRAGGAEGTCPAPLFVRTLLDVVAPIDDPYQKPPSPSLVATTSTHTFHTQLPTAHIDGQHHGPVIFHKVARVPRARPRAVARGRPGARARRAGGQGRLPRPQEQVCALCARLSVVLGPERIHRHPGS